MTKEEALSLANSYKQALLKNSIPFTSVILFGSCARNDSSADSDIDIAVIGKSFLSSRQEEAVAVRKARWPVSMKIHPVWMHAEHLEDIYSSLSQEIKKDGIEI